MTFLTYIARWSASNGLPPSEDQSHRQSAWDRPGILLARAHVETALSYPRQNSCFLATTARHSDDWLTALPIASCGLWLSDEAICIAAALRLELDLCVSHVYRCGSQADAWGLHAFICKQASG